MDLKKIIWVALLSTVAFIVLWVRFSVPGPFGSSFRFELSLAVALFATLELGKGCGLCIELVLWVMRLLLGNGTMGIGPTIDFLVGAFAVLALVCAQKLAPGRVFRSACVCATLCGFFSLGLNFLAKPCYRLLLGPGFVQHMFKCIVLAAGVFTFFKVLACGLLAHFMFKRFRSLRHTPSLSRN